MSSHTARPAWRGILALALVVSALSALLVSPARAAGNVSLSAFGATYIEEFNSLASSGTAATLPNGWYFSETGTNANTIYTAGTGSSNAGDTYSFGASGSAERALGGLLSGSLTPTIGASFTNNTGGTITSLSITYDGEQWRLGTSGRGSDRLDFQISTNATSLTSGTWADVNSLDFSSPVTSGSLGSTGGASTTVSDTITGLSIPNGATFWIRWTDFNVTNADDGLAVDNFRLNPAGVLADEAPTVASTSPSGGATDVLITSNIGVTFSEPVNAGGSAFSLVCGASTISATVSGGPSSFTLNPDSDLPNGENCTLTVLAANVSDVDGNDPPDTMAANYITGFSTIGPDDAPSVASTVPADGATNVALNQNISITFSEPVTVSDPWFSLSCSASGAKSATVSGGPSSFTLNPTTDFVYGEQCQLVIDAEKVSDQDGNDPPDTMVLDFTVGFSTELDPCTLSYTPIYTIQGSSASAAVTGSVSTLGVVVGDYEYPGSGSTASSLRGFYLQDVSGDGDSATSDGIFVFNGNNNSVSLGDIVRVTGTAGDFQDQTQITGLTSLRKCGSGSVAPVDVTLPFASATEAERYEGMLVRLPQTLYVTEHFQLGRFGQVVVSANGRLAQPTNLFPAGPAAAALQLQNSLNRIIIDDASQGQNPDPIAFGRGGQPLSASNTLRGGDTATGTVGVMSYTWAGAAASGNAYRVRPIGALGGAVSFTPANPRPTAVPEVGGSLTVASYNVLNYFVTVDPNTNDSDNFTADDVCGPLKNQECRGADNITGNPTPASTAERTRQETKLIQALLKLDADVYGLIELENTAGAEPLARLVDLLNAQAGAGSFAYITTGTIGGDAIKVGIIYKPASVTPAGDYQTLDKNDDPRFNSDIQRPALAQTFTENATGARFTVVVNHFKSKNASGLTDTATATRPAGICVDSNPANDTLDCDQGDGQGFWNYTRTLAAQALADWLASDPTASGDTDFLLLGDLNAYAKEDPVLALEAAGFINLVPSFEGPDAYSYAFDGQWGSLDHGLASADLAAQISGAKDYHINADEPSVLDYNSEFKSAGQQTSLYSADEFRTSDHDPVVVGLNLNAAPTVAASFGPAVGCGVASTLSGTISDPNANDSFTAVVDWGDGSAPESVTVTDRAFSASHTYAKAGIYTATVTVADSFGESATAEAETAVNFTVVGGGLLQPINQDGSSVFRYGSTIPVKLRLQDCDGSFPANLAPTIKLTQLSGSTPGGEINEPVSTGNGDSGNVLRYDAASQQYIFNLATKPLPDPTATYEITITVPATGQTVKATFGLR